MQPVQKHQAVQGPSGYPHNLISRKKQLYPVSDYFQSYLERYDRIETRGVRYEDLARYEESIPLYDETGNDTLWATVFYKASEQREIHDDLLETYAIIRADGDLSAVKDLNVDRVDLCLYGNTLPFRVRIINAINENFDYFYVKRTDANRIYGLELEHILSPSRIHYFIKGHTLIEEHIIGIPADNFLRDDLPPNRFDRVRLAKEFVKFDLRCFVRLLGDMHAGNFVVDIRRGITDLDQALFDMVGAMLPIHVLLTKSDKLTRSEVNIQIMQTRQQMKHSQHTVSSLSTLNRQGLEQLELRCSQWLEIE